MEDVVFVGPCKIPCPQNCDVPAGVTLAPVPRPRHAWGDVVACPNDDCDRAFLVKRAIEVDESLAPFVDAIFSNPAPEPRR